MSCRHGHHIESMLSYVKTDLSVDAYLCEGYSFWISSRSNFKRWIVISHIWSVNRCIFTIRSDMMEP